MPKALLLALCTSLTLSACVTAQPKDTPEDKPEVSTATPLTPPAADDADALFAYALALEGQGKEQEAIAYYLQATQVKPEFLKAHIALAQLYTKYNRSEEAKVAYENVLRLDRNHPFVALYKEARLKYYSASNIAQNEEYAKALKLLSEAPKNTPLDTEIAAKAKLWEAEIKNDSQKDQQRQVVEAASLLAYQGKYTEAVAKIRTAPDGDDENVQRKIAQWQEAMSKGGSTPPASSAPEISTDRNARYIIGDKVNLRQSPYLYAESLEVLNNNNPVELLLDKGYEADGYQWSKVRSKGGKVGWVASNLLKTSLAQVAARPTPLPTSPQQVAQQAGTSDSGETYGTRYVSGDMVNVRRSPSLNGTLVSRARQGSAVILMSARDLSADGYNWRKIRLSDGQIGWIASDFLGAEPVGQSAQPASKPATSTPAATKTRYAYVSGTGVNVRSGPETGASIVTQLSAPAKVVMGNIAPVKKDGYVWQQITAGDKTGWIVTQFLSAKPVTGGGASSSTTAAATRHIRGDQVNIRKEAGIGKALLTQLSEGSEVVLLTTSPLKKDGYNWYKIRTSKGEIGWVAGDFLGR